MYNPLILKPTVKKCPLITTSLLYLYLCPIQTLSTLPLLLVLFSLPFYSNPLNSSYLLSLFLLLLSSYLLLFASSLFLSSSLPFTFSLSFSYFFFLILPLASPSLVSSTPFCTLFLFFFSLLLCSSVTFSFLFFLRRNPCLCYTLLKGKQRVYKV